MPNKKKAIVKITRDARKKHDILIGVGGVITSTKDITILIENEHEDKCDATKLIKMKLKRGDHEIIEE